MYVPGRSGIILNKLGVLTSAVTVGNTTTETLIIAPPNSITWPNELATGGAGATVRFEITGYITWQATSGILTFRVYLGATAAAQTFVMPTQGSAAATAIPFALHLWATVRTTGASGTYIAGGYGLAWPSTTTVVYITPAAGSGLSSTTAIDTTAQTLNGAKVTAQWATAVAANTLTATVGTIERSV
jgi:hypothetical protein